MTLYKELYDVDNGLFTQVFAANHSELFKELFGDVSAQQADIMAWQQYGGRGMVDFGANDLYAKIADAFIQVNAPKWLSIANALKTQYDLLAPTLSTTVTTTTQKDTANDERLHAQKAYNDTVFADDTRETTTNGKTSDVTATTESRGSGGNMPQDVITKEINLRQRNFINDVIKEVVYSITLSIY